MPNRANKPPSNTCKMSSNYKVLFSTTFISRINSKIPMSGRGKLKSVKDIEIYYVPLDGTHDLQVSMHLAPFSASVQQSVTLSQGSISREGVYVRQRNLIYIYIYNCGVKKKMKMKSRKKYTMYPQLAHMVLCIYDLHRYCHYWRYSNLSYSRIHLD